MNTPIVRDAETRPFTYPNGHWMNRYWGTLARGVVGVVGRVPLFRYVLRAHPAAQELLDSGETVILACIHQDVFDCYNGLPRLLGERSLATMSSYSRDGSLAIMALQTLGYKVIRGSSSHGGGEGLMMLRGLLVDSHSVVMAVDGPKPPLGDVKPGVVRLAASAGAPIIPIRAAGFARLRFHSSWMKLALSPPFGPVAICLGEPIRVPERVDEARPYQLQLATSIVDLAEWASEWTHGPGVAPFKVAEA